MSAVLEAAGKSEVLQHFQCGICLESVHEARLCPSCSKLFCQRCIRGWIDKGANSCPNCRNEVPGESWVQGYSINQIQESLRKLFSSMENQNDGLLCKEHANQQLSLFCYLCEANICVKCWFSEAHAEHKDRTVPIEEAFEHFQQNLKTSLHWVSERKDVLDEVLQKIHENEKKLSDERDLAEELCVKSKALVADKPHPVTLTQIIQTDRAIVKLRTDHQDETKAMRIDRRRDFVPEPTVLSFCMKKFEDTMRNEWDYFVHVKDPLGSEWKCTITEDRNKRKTFRASLCLTNGKSGEYSVVYGNDQEKIYRLEKGRDKILGPFDPTEHVRQDTQEFRIQLSQSYGDRLDQLQDYIGRLEKENAEYKALKKYLAEWESKIAPSSG